MDVSEGVGRDGQRRTRPETNVLSDVLGELPRRARRYGTRNEYGHRPGTDRLRRRSRRNRCLERLTLLAPSTPLLVLEWAIAATVFAQLLGLPIAWLKLRRTEVWRKRNPREEWAIGLLDRFIGMYAFAAGITGAAMGLATWLGTTLV
jgi:hypothetical protein